MTWQQFLRYHTKKISSKRNKTDQLNFIKIKYICAVESGKDRGAWVAQLVERSTLAQVMISQLVSLSPVSGSVLTAQSLEPASASVSPTLSAPPPLMLCLSLKN